MAAFGDADFFNVPISIDGRFLFIADGAVSPYVRGGVSYNIASGDYVDSSSVGFLGGVGVEFLRDRAVGFGFEISYDTSEVDLDDWKGGTESVQPRGFMVSVFAVF